LDSKTSGNYYFKHVQFDFSDRITYNLEMPVKNQLQGMLAVFEPIDRAQSKKNFEPSFVKIR
jgi:hypothetical protein